MTFKERLQLTQDFLIEHSDVMTAKEAFVHYLRYSRYELLRIKIARLRVKKEKLRKQLNDEMTVMYYRKKFKGL